MFPRFPSIRSASDMHVPTLSVVPSGSAPQVPSTLKNDKEHDSDACLFGMQFVSDMSCVSKQLTDIFVFVWKQKRF